MYMKVLIYAITALASFLSFEAVHQGLVVYNGWPTPPYWSPAPTPPSNPRKPNAKDFANLYDAAEVFNSSNLLPLNPLYESLFKLSRCETPIEHKDQPGPSPPTWRDLLWRSIRDLLLCELKFYWWIERVFWFCLLGQHVKATETERQEQCRLEETRAETRQAEAEQLGRQSAELRKKVASIREEHDGKLADLKSAQLVEMEDERKEHTATREEHNKLLSKIDDLEQRNVKLEHNERQQKLDASEKKASQVKLELLRRELAALHEKVFLPRGEHQ